MPFASQKARSEYQNRWMQERRRNWLLQHGPCVDCGSWRYLEVDHVDPSTKVDHRVWSWSNERREKELAKCVVRCRPCHRKKTAKELGFTSIKHGTYTGYLDHKCRCAICRKFHARQMAGYRARKRAILAVTEQGLHAAG
jgi:hypothetical protein